MKIIRPNPMPPDGGVYLCAETEEERIQSLSVQHNCGSIEFTVKLSADYAGKVDEPMQYLTPQEAMALAKGLERCAIAALKEGA